jgi:hypothetical protein
MENERVSLMKTKIPTVSFTEIPVGTYQMSVLYVYLLPLRTGQFSAI